MRHVVEKLFRSVPRLPPVPTLPLNSFIQRQSRTILQNLPCAPPVTAILLPSFFSPSSYHHLETLNTLSFPPTLQDGRQTSHDPSSLKRSPSPRFLMLSTPLAPHTYFSNRDTSSLTWAWHRLAHVCQRWRYIIFASPRSLGLRLVISSGRCGTTLDLWTPLPISVYYTLTSALSAAVRLELLHVYLPSNILDQQGSWSPGYLYPNSLPFLFLPILTYRRRVLTSTSKASLFTHLFSRRSVFASSGNMLYPRTSRSSPSLSPAQNT